ncbi:hypothetical protein F5Y10DRAFT_285296 [Nemania abortiva]|nr:hypothetical protein F5Y10DRAFT_285296 [Nemania abortiva]
MHHLRESFSGGLLITDQADIDGVQFQQLTDVYFDFYVRNAKGTLNFSNLTRSNIVDVQSSPELEALEFPDLDQLASLQIIEATSLTNISLPALGSSIPCSAPLLDLNITGPMPLKYFTIRDPSCLFRITLFDVESPWNDFDPPLGDLRYIYNITANSDLSLPSLVDGGPDISLLNIEDTMVVESSTYLNYNYLGRIDRIGGDLNIISNTDVHIGYDSLTNVGKSLSIRNNTNCTFNFDKVSNISTLLITENVKTQVPHFASLERAENIYISGLIDTSTGPNIFPALRYVSGNVTIEALNDDFDCSKLVSQWKDQTIHNLRCVGRNNVTDTSILKSDNGTNTSKPNSSPRLSPGGWAGIGVGTGIIVIGILAVLVWLIVYYRRQARALERGIPQGPVENEPKEPEQPHILQTQEMCGRGIFREMPDDPLVELPTQPVELPTRPHSWAGTEEGRLL